MTDEIFIDSDNAMGSPYYGDVDDGYAIAALLRSGLPIFGIGAVRGNTPAQRAFENNRRLADHFGYDGPVLPSPDVPDFLRGFRGRVMALGPLTNVASALHEAAFSEVVIVGADSQTRGRWPPIWPREFNLVIDRAAARAVFDSAVPLTIFPLNIAGDLRVLRQDVDMLPDYFRQHTRRWFRYLRFVKMTNRFPIWDLAATMYAIEPEAYRIERTTATMRKNTFIEFGRGGREVRVCRGFDRDRVWGRFVKLVSS
ncbi:MAG: nucleoside hydrolase [Thermoanaerobaculia bacterium]